MLSAPMWVYVVERSATASPSSLSLRLEVGGTILSTVDWEIFAVERFLQVLQIVKNFPMKFIPQRIITAMKIITVLLVTRVQWRLHWGDALALLRSLTTTQVAAHPHYSVCGCVRIQNLHVKHIQCENFLMYGSSIQCGGINCWSTSLGLEVISKVISLYI